MVCALILGSGVGVLRSFAADYAIDWYVVGAGGSSSGGVYTVSGTVGEPSASQALTNAQYTLVGGFWALPVLVQSTNAPVLTVVPAAPGFALISWAPDVPGFVLQESPTISPAAWTNAPSGAGNPALVPAGLPLRFYRLRQE